MWEDVPLIDVDGNEAAKDQAVPMSLEQTETVSQDNKTQMVRESLSWVKFGTFGNYLGILDSLCL